MRLLSRVRLLSLSSNSVFLSVPMFVTSTPLPGHLHAPSSLQVHTCVLGTDLPYLNFLDTTPGWTPHRDVPRAPVLSASEETLPAEACGSPCVPHTAVLVKHSLRPPHCHLPPKQEIWDGNLTRSQGPTSSRHSSDSHPLKLSTRMSSTCLEINTIKERPLGLPQPALPTRVTQEQPCPPNTGAKKLGALPRIPSFSKSWCFHLPLSQRLLTVPS